MTRHPPIANATESTTITTELSQRPNSSNFQRALIQITNMSAIMVPTNMR